PAHDAVDVEREGHAPVLVEVEGVLGGRTREVTQRPGGDDEADRGGAALVVVVAGVGGDGDVVGGADGAAPQRVAAGDVRRQVVGHARAALDHAGAAHRGRDPVSLTVIDGGRNRGDARRGLRLGDAVTDRAAGALVVIVSGEEPGVTVAAGVGV